MSLQASEFHELREVANLLLEGISDRGVESACRRCEDGGVHSDGSIIQQFNWMETLLRRFREKLSINERRIDHPEIDTRSYQKTEELWSVYRQRILGIFQRVLGREPNLDEESFLCEVALVRSMTEITIDRINALEKREEN